MNRSLCVRCERDLYSFLISFLPPADATKTNERKYGRIFSCYRDHQELIIIIFLSSTDLAFTFSTHAQAEVEQAQVEIERLRAEAERQKNQAQVEIERLRAEAECQKSRAQVEIEHLRAEAECQKYRAQVEIERLRSELERQKDITVTMSKFVDLVASGQLVRKSSDKVAHPPHTQPVPPSPSQALLPRVDSKGFQSPSGKSS